MKKNLYLFCNVLCPFFFGFSLFCIVQLKLKNQDFGLILILTYLASSFLYFKLNARNLLLKVHFIWSFKESGNIFFGGIFAVVQDISFAT